MPRSRRGKLSPVPRLPDRLENRLPAGARRVLKRSRGQDLLLFAAGLAFYALVSIVPLLIFVLWVVSLFLGDARVHTLARELGRVAPKNLDVGRFVERVAALGTSLGVPALLVGLWPASSYGAGLRRAFDRLSRRSRSELKGLRGRGVVLVVLLPVLVTGSLLGSYAGTAVLGEGAFVKALGVLLALLTGFVGAALGVALIYRIFPPDPLDWRGIIRGTIWSAGTISLLSLAFTLFLTLGADFQKRFAFSGLAGIVLLGLWLLCSNALLLVGFNVAQEASRS